jgi:transposase
MLLQTFQNLKLQDVNDNIKVNSSFKVKVRRIVHFLICPKIKYNLINLCEGVDKILRNDIKNELMKYQGKELELLNKSELARRMNCNRRTIDRYINGVPPRKQREYNSLLDDYKSIIIDKVDTYGASAMAAYKFIEKKGYTAKYNTVANFVRSHKDSEQQKATIRFETTPGLQAQVDWKEHVKMVSRSGEAFEVQIFLMVLGYSRLKFLRLTVDKTQKTLFMCMFEAIKYFCGVPHEILFDNMATVVDRDKSTFKSVALNQTFKHFADDAGFTPVTCRPYRPKTKGKVEALAKLVDRLKAYNEEFEDYEDLERITNEFMDDINNEVSQATFETPNERFKKEKEYLCQLPKLHVILSYFSYHKEYKVSKESMVTYKGQKYSVPIKYIGHLVNVLEDDEGIKIYYMEDIITCHYKSEKRLNYKHEHAREILKSDALKYMSNDEIDSFIESNLSKMDMLLT